MKTIQFGSSEIYDYGRNCSVALNLQNAIEVHNSKHGSNMWYRIGKVNGATVHWCCL